MRSSIFNFRRACSLALISVSLALSGCTTLLDKPVPEHASIAVLTPRPTPPLVVHAVFAPKSWLPVVGLKSLIESHETQTFVTEQLTAQGFDISSELQKAVVEKLATAGYKTRYEHVDRTHLEAADGGRDSADAGRDFAGGGQPWAFLDIRVSDYGFAAEFSSEIRPFLRARMTLLDGATRKVIYSRWFAYNVTNVGTDAVGIPHEPADQWANFETMRGNTARIRGALENAAARMASGFSADVKKRR